MKILLGKPQIALRKCKQGNQTITADQLKQQGGLERRIHHDKDYKFLRALRGSSPYFGDILHVFYIFYIFYIFYMSAAMYFSLAVGLYRHVSVFLDVYISVGLHVCIVCMFVSLLVYVCISEYLSVCQRVSMPACVVCKSLLLQFDMSVIWL